jgi:ATPase subunit of ABC transporter with duplicated ATPase domains
MALITLLNAQLAFGHVALLDRTGFSLETNERVGLIGRNGAGKSSLLRILGGLAKADDGTLQVQQGTRIAFVEQEPALDPERHHLPGRLCRAGRGDSACASSTWPMPRAWTWTRCKARLRPPTPGTGNSACRKPCSACT